jgi:hypothetical protein
MVRESRSSFIADGSLVWTLDTGTQEIRCAELGSTIRRFVGPDSRAADGCTDLVALQ